MAIIGPENPLQEGVSDKLWSSGIPVVGPKKPGSNRTSKTFTRNLLKNIISLEGQNTKHLILSMVYKNFGRIG